MSERDMAREVAERAIRKNHERLVGPISDAEWASDKCNSPFRLDIAVAAIGAREALLEAAKVAAEWGEGPSTMHLTIGEFANRYGEHDCLYDVLRALAGERCICLDGNQPDPIRECSVHGERDDG